MQMMHAHRTHFFPILPCALTIHAHTHTSTPIVYSPMRWEHTKNCTERKFNNNKHIKQVVKTRHIIRKYYTNLYASFFVFIIIVNFSRCVSLQFTIYFSLLCFRCLMDGQKKWNSAVYRCIDNDDYDESATMCVCVRVDSVKSFCFSFSAVVAYNKREVIAILVTRFEEEEIWAWLWTTRQLERETKGDIHQ